MYISFKINSANFFFHENRKKTHKEEIVMKHIKKCMALVLALGMLGSLSAFYACADVENENNTNSPPTSSENTDSSLQSSIIIDSENSEFLENSSAFDDFSSENTPSSSIPPAQDSSSENANDSSSENTSNSTPNTPSEPVALSAQYIQCTGSNVNIRAGAGTEYSVLGSAEKGTMYALIEKKGSWYKTYYRNKVAYIYAQYAQVITLEKSQNADAEDVIEEGYKLIGTPYVYGAVRFHDGSGKLLAGFSTQKFDCSSLMQYVFYQGADTIIGSHTRAQVKQGKYVHPNELQRGDCLFFTNEDRQYNTGIERVGHVALYLGNNYILHTASDYARIEKITASRWKFFIEARRFV